MGPSERRRRLLSAVAHYPPAVALTAAPRVFSTSRLLELLAALG
jgi:hypothetical protein